MTIREEIDAQFPIRKTTAQKRAFEKWVMAKMREMGYRPYVDGMNRKDKLRHRNIVAGDPQNAELLISAHYDTAATIGVPDLRIPRNFPVYILSQGAVLLGMLLISLLIGTAVGLATKSGDWLILTFFFAYLVLMLLMMFGAANKHNVNDNTSGIAALLETMQRLSPEAREKTAFILFDHQETGSRGAKSYGAQHVEVQTMKLLVDLNCVGDGDTFVISAPKMDSDEATQLIVETLEKNINFDEWKIYEIRWMEADELENNLTVLFVEMVNKAGDCFSQTFTLSGPGKGNISDLNEAGGLRGKLDFEKVKGLTPASINVEAIRKQYEEAKAMIPENYTFKSIGDYLIQEKVPSGNEFLDRNKTFGEVKAEFSMNITENGKEIVESAGKKSVQYYEVTFNVLPDGSVQMEE